MKRRTIIAVCASATAIAALAAAAVAQEVTFAYQFALGTSERHRLKMNQEADMGGMAMSNLADMEVTVTCVAKAEDNYRMEMKFDKVDLSTTMMGNTSANPMGEQLVGQAIEFLVAPSGKVTDVKPVGTFEAWGALRSMIEPVAQNWYVRLPSGAVAPGGEWRQEPEKDVDASGTETVTKASCKFKEMKKEKGRDYAVIDENMEATIGGTSRTPMGTFALAGTATGKSELLFDVAKGRIAKVKGKTDASMDMTPQSGGDAVKAVFITHVERTLLN